LSISQTGSRPRIQAYQTKPHWRWCRSAGDRQCLGTLPRRHLSTT